MAQFTPERMENELNQLLYDAFLLGMRVVWKASGVEAPMAKEDKSWDLLHDLANGQQTIFDPESMLRSVPDDRKSLFRHASDKDARQMQERDKDLAQRIIAGQKLRLG
jgi:hypothetical protein